MSGRSRPVVALSALVAVLLLAPAGAQAQQAGGRCNVTAVTNFLAADATEPGVITLLFFGARGRNVQFFECVGGNLRSLGAQRGAVDEATILRDATRWKCTRPSRRFEAVATLPDGSRATGAFSVQTGSCSSRFAVSVPRRVGVGRVARVRISDGWRLGGVKPRLCLTPPRGKRTCSSVRFGRAVTVKTHRFRPRTRGRWRVELRIRSHRVRRSVTVGAGRASKPPTTVLATGDSTMQGVENFLADELGDTATVRSDVRPGTGISKSDWRAIARAQVKRHRPDVTVMSVGVNEGFKMRTPAGSTQPCCDELWEIEYARRARAMMRRYLRDGRGRVVWLTLMLPRSGSRTAMTLAVNRAILRASRGLDRVAVARMDLLFSPDGFTETIRYRGRTISVRTADGIHLNVAGTAIAAKVIADLLRGR